jgi:hypothetical protein
MNTQDIESLEAMLDGELDPSAATELRTRIERESDLASLYGGLKEERELRNQTYALLEPSRDKAQRIALAVCSSVRGSSPRKWGLGRVGMFRMVGSVAACVLVGFGVGWLSRGAYQKPVAFSTPVVETYNVNITDTSGKVISVVAFHSADQAQQFAQDLENWQKQQTQLRGGYIVVRSGEF